MGAGRAPRRGPRAVVRGEAAGLAGFSVSFFVASSEDVSAAFSGAGDGFASAVSVTSAGGRGIVAPTDDKRLADALVELSADSVFSATGIPPLNGSKVPPK